MFNKRIVITEVRTYKWQRVLIGIIVGLGLFVGGFVTAAKIYGFPPMEPIATPHQTPHNLDVADLPAIVEGKDTRWKYTSLEKELTCLAENIYFEGRDQDLKGQLAIGLTTINRVESKHFKNSICDVVWFQGKDRNTGKLTAHFSWTLDGKTDRIRNKPVYNDIKLIASALIADGTLDNIDDFTNGSTHYHANYVSPYWKKELENTITVGKHLYYRFKSFLSSRG